MGATSQPLSMNWVNRMGSSLTKDIRPEALIVLDSIRMPIPYQIEGPRVTPGGYSVGGHAPPGVGSQVMGLAQEANKRRSHEPDACPWSVCPTLWGCQTYPWESGGGRLPGKVSYSGRGAYQIYVPLAPPGGMGDKVTDRHWMSH